MYVIYCLQNKLLMVVLFCFSAKNGEKIMGRRVKHIHAKPGEYVKVHRGRRHGGGGSKNDSNNWLRTIFVALFILFVINSCSKN